MEVHFTRELEKKLNDLAVQSGRAAAELAVTGFVEELAGTREMLDSRYDDMRSGKVKPIEGEAFFEALRQREDELLKPS